MSTRRRWLQRTVVTGAVIVAGALVAVRSDAFLSWAADALEALIERQTGESVVIGGLVIKPLQGVVVLNGLVISDNSTDPQRAGSTIAAVDRLVARISLRGGPSLYQLDVFRPVVRLHIDDDGLREFRSAPSGGAPLERFPWTGLLVHDGELSVEGPGDASVSASGLDLAHWGERADLSIDTLSIGARGISQQATAVQLTSVHLTTQQVQIPSLDLQFTDLRLQGSAGVEAGGGLTGDLQLDTSLDLLDPALPGNLSLAGAVEVDVELGGAVDSPSLVGALVLRDGMIIRADLDRRFPLGQQLTAGWSLADRQLTIAPLITSWGGGLVEISGAIDLHSLGVQLSVSGEGLSLAQTAIDLNTAQTPWVAMLADLEIQAAGTLRPLRLAGSADIAATDLRIASGPIQAPGSETILALPRLVASTQVSIQDKVLALGIRSLRTPRSAGEGEARFSLGGGGMSVDLAFAPLDLQELRPLAGLELEGRGPVQVRIAGPYSHLTVDAHAALQDFAMLGLPLADELQGDILAPDLQHLRFPDFSARRGESAYAGQLEVDLAADTIDLQVLLSTSRLSDLVGVVVDIPGMEADVEGVMSLSGPPDALDGEIQLSFSQIDLFGERFAEGEATAWMDAGRFTLERMDLRRPRPGGVENLHARGSVGAGWATNIEIVAGGARLEHLDHITQQLPLQGQLLLDATIGGTLMQPEPRGRLALRQTWLADRQLDDTTLHFSTTDGVMSIEGGVAGAGMTVDGSLELWEEQRYSFSAALDAFPLHALYPRAPDGSPVRAVLTGALSLSGALGVEEPVHLSADIEEAALDWGRHQLRSQSPWRYEQVGTAFTLRGVSLAGGETDVLFGGTRTAEGQTLFAGGGAVDLDLLRLVVPALDRAEGSALVNFSITGSPGQMQSVVDATLQDALLEGQWFPQPIESLSGRITAAPEGYDLRDLTGRIGGGDLTLSGRIDATGWVPRRYDLSGRLTDARIRYFDFLPPITGDAALSLSGPSSDLLLSGDITVDEMVFSERIDWESWVLELSGERLSGAVSAETEDLFAMDIDVVSHDTIRMRNNVADLTAGGQLTIMGDTARPGMSGSIRTAPGGRVYLKERSFELQRGELNFIEPFSFDPDVDIAMTTDIQGRDQDYEVDYRVLGRYSEWYTETSSSPSLPQADINALLLFGMTREELERYGGLSSALVWEGGDLLASNFLSSKYGFALVERVGEGIFQSDLLRLDRVDLISGVSERGLGTVSSELRLLAEKDLDFGGTVTLEQNLNRVNDTYLSLEQRLARKLYLRGYWATEQQGRYLNIGGAYGLDFNLRWELD